MGNNNLFSKLPKVDQLLADKELKCLLDIYPREVVVEVIREKLDVLRDKIARNDIEELDLINEIGRLAQDISKTVHTKMAMKLRSVVNCTGVVIHTNLGRSLIGEEAIKAVSEVASNYSNLEYNLETGARGSRYSHIEEIITRITGSEAAMVVNNNAAAVMLVLSSMAKSKEVVVSRGELVEIGGSFRVPEVMEQSGAHLIEVGTTNKTHLNDYERAIGENTAALMKVHTSNYRILGFTESVEIYDLVKLGRQRNIPVIEDIGSGVLIDLSKYGLGYEPTVQKSIEAGIDIVTFSGDKLLGGPQAGIIIGKKKYIDMMKKNPLTRALRVDKFTISALEATLRLYLNEDEAIRKIPTLNMLTATIDEIEKRAFELTRKIKDRIGLKLVMEVVDDYSQVGGGAMPLEEIPTKVIMIYSHNMKIVDMEKALRDFKVPIITRIYKDRLYIDLRTVKDEELDIIVDAFGSIDKDI